MGLLNNYLYLARKKSLCLVFAKRFAEQRLCLGDAAAFLARIVRISSLLEQEIDRGFNFIAIPFADLFLLFFVFHFVTQKSDFPVAKTRQELRRLKTESLDDFRCSRDWQMVWSCGQHRL
ncbi:hypothetical protein Q31b_08960 [Novipirellula aureliae]|uniref:Uncharacterized protein n=1 Tax=Novipirellula aureliae TaxID=2527966 RepID=A0A5C6EAH5_9BACT|nr:hypothetical protein Q31b_08960 [Novipirellula aureliae]